MRPLFLSSQYLQLYFPYFSLACLFGSVTSSQEYPTVSIVWTVDTQANEPLVQR
jgi:hypothetical protein